MKRIGIIGGSGLENPNLLKEQKELIIDTPYGVPSSTLLLGKINEVEIVLLSRHGRQHSIPPTQINNRANIFALKEAKCTHIIATTACGSLKENIKRGDLVILDQFIDFTKHRQNTFYESFENGKMKHTPMSDPFDKNLREIIEKCGKKLNLSVHSKGTVITIEGPRFSTRAESMMYKQWGGDVINMSTAPEAALANEMQLPYAAIAMSTDYDCWKTDEEPVTWEAVMQVFNNNVKNVIDLLLLTIQNI